MPEARFARSGIAMLFPTPLLSYQIADAERINAQLLEEIAIRRESDPGVVRSNRSGWHSESDFFTRPEPGHRALSQAIKDVVADATRRVSGAPQKMAKVQFRVNGWLNINPRDAYNVPHDHPGSFWSGAYYIQNDAVGPEAGDAGAITFIDGRCAPAGQPLIHAKVFAGAHTVRPEPGTVLLFPSNAKHWVHPNHSDSDRITMAFNVFMFELAPQLQGKAPGNAEAVPAEIASAKA